MTLIDRIKNDPILRTLVRDTCSERNAYVSVSSDIPRDRYVILKPDAYYNSLNVGNRPNSPDCLIIQRCEGNIERYSVTIVELRDRRKGGDFTVEELKEKFEICLNDFMGRRFKDLLNRDYKQITLYFVTTNPSYTSLKSETLMNTRIPFREKKYSIRYRTPIIKPC